MTGKRKLLILFGGVSLEHQISRLSAASVLDHIDKSKYQITVIGITEDGRWYKTEATTKEIEVGSWETSSTNTAAVISPDRKTHGILIAQPDGSYREERVDVVFPVMHGKNSEDGTLQGLLQLAGLPFVGPGTASSAACMDKAITKAMIAQAGRVAQADHCLCTEYEFRADPEAAMKRILRYFDGRMPLFIKPANTGSSVGITKIKTAEELEDAMEVAFLADEKVLVEEAITGREIEIAVLGNEEPMASRIGEILSANEFYDFNAKYENAASRTEFVRDLPEELETRIREAAIDVYKTMGCKGLARADFFLQEDGRIVFNELNTIPGFTSISMYPQLWEEAGIPYAELIDRLIELALAGEDDR